MNEFNSRKEKIYSLLCDENYIPMKIKELAILLDIPRERREELQEVLDALIADGKAEVTKKGKYQKASVHFVTGEFTGNARGFGFVSTEGETEDYFIPEKYTGGALHGDMVKIAVLPGTRGEKREAKVIEVLSRGMNQLVGTYHKSKSFGFVVPDNGRFSQDVFIPQGADLHAVSGHKVVCRITDFGSSRRKPEGRITEILGHVNDPGVDVLSTIRAFDLPVEFPQKVLEQAQRVAKDVTDADMAGRLDLRMEMMVTIDGEDAKDLDDAVSVRKEGDEYILGVHIADVTNYVQENSALDKEALRRGTSVYLVDRVIPMLQHTLSNGICSLNQGEDRLALSCIMRINAKGKVVDHQIAESVVCVDRRMSYASVKKILEDQDEQEISRHEQFVPMLRLMGELSRIIRKKRMARGSLDFDFPETKIELDDSGHPTSIRPYERNIATDLIEDFMLTANETVAEHFFWQESPFLYRTHGTPDSDKVRKLAAIIGGFGYTLKGISGNIHPKELQKLLGKIAGSKQEDFISRMVLRSMQRAVYTTECKGHFGLAAEYYCHFTSPIRRYPDLQIHRIIKEHLRTKFDDERRIHYEAILTSVAVQSSKLERRADEVEREVEKLKKVQYMADHIGDQYDGLVSGVTAWGIYVELPNTVEGLVHISDLQNDFYYFSEETMELIGEHTNSRFRMGQKVRIQVAATDVATKTIDFMLVEEKNE